MNAGDIKIGTKIELEVYDELGDRIKPSFVSEYEWAEDDKTFYILAPIHEGVIYPVHSDSRMNIYFTQQEDLFKVKAKVEGRDSKDNIPLLKVKVLSEFEKMQRRQFFRFDSSVPVIYRTGSWLVQQNNKKAPMENAITKDLSGGGLCLLTVEPLEGHSLIECEVKLEEKRAIKVVGKVVRVAKVTDQGVYKYEIGVNFIKIENKDREAIISYIFQEQRKLRKKGLI